jgi:hypothetical protein
VGEQVIVGEAVAGQSKKVRKEIDALIKSVNASNFDLAERLWAVKKNAWFSPDFDSFGDYAKSLDLKVSKSYYLVKIQEAMNAAGVPRDKYEQVGIAKLRSISRIDLKESDAVEKIKALVDGAGQMDLEAVSQSVATAQGLVGDDAMVWLNITLKKAARDEVVKPALELAKKNIGTVGQDEDGNGKDASDGAALEAVCADFLSDPHNNFDTDALNKDEKELHGEV